jgi:hypothetical protein
MKQKDVVVIIVVIVFSSIFSFILSGILLKPSAESKTAEVVQPISSQLGKPNSTDFSSNSINPTQIISIGNNNNPNPF